MQVSFGSVSAPVKKISREQLLKINVSKILSGPQGHPYTGRSILNSGMPCDNSFLGKLKRTKDILLGKNTQAEVKQPEVPTSETVEFFKSAGSAVKKGLGEIIDSLF